MKSATRFALLAGSLLLFGTGCAHHRDVRPGEDGVNRIVLKSEDKDGAFRNAMSQAEDYCKMSNRAPVVMKEGTQYSGDMDESTYNNGKRISKAAKMAGGAVWAMGAPKESNAGGVVGLGGSVGDSVLGQGYTYEMRFRCQ